MNIIDEIKLDEGKLISDDLHSDVSYYYPFSCLPLDIAFGGGLPSGKIVEFYGLPSSGKSTLALEASKAFSSFWLKENNNNFAIIWFDTENAVDKLRTVFMDCYVQNFIFHTIETVEDGFDLMKQYLEKALNKKIKLLFCWDTIAGCPTRNEKNPKRNKIDGQENRWSGGRAEKPRVIKAEIERITPELGKTNSTLIFVNQVYNSMQMYGGPTIIAPGGEGIKFHASIRSCLTQKGLMTASINNRLEPIGIKTELHQVKNKLTCPNVKLNLTFLYEKGLDTWTTLYDYLLENRLVEITGAWKVLKLPDKEIKFINQQNLKEIIELKDNTAQDFIKYQIMTFITAEKSLMKIRLIDNIWTLEEKFFGKRKTELTEKETIAYEFLHKNTPHHQQQQQHNTQHDIKKTTKKKDNELTL